MSRARLTAIVALALLAAPVAGCYAPHIADEQYACTVTAECPDGQHCSRCGTCIAKSKDISECRIDNPCTNGIKARTADDKKLPRVAFCPAAFLEPGTQAPPQCANAPGPDGVSLDGKKTNCALSDNCAAGWHVCNDADLVNGGLTTQSCADAKGFYISRQPGAPGGTAASCGISGDGVVLGCGGGNMVGRATTCNVLDRALVLPFDCTAARDECRIGSPGSTITRADASKPGGVLCCK